MKHLEVHLGENLWNLGLGEEFVDMTRKKMIN